MQLDVQCQGFTIHGAQFCGWPPQLVIRAIAQEWLGDRGGILPRSGLKRAAIPRRLDLELGTFYSQVDLRAAESVLG